MTSPISDPCDELRHRIPKEGQPSSAPGVLLVTVLGSSLAIVVGSIMNVALPAMQEEFSTDAAGVQWIVNAYLLPLSALVLGGGALGDHYGRKRFFLIGLLLFTSATFGCAISSTLPLLLAARFLQGIGAALIAPNSLAILADAFSGEKRGKAVGTWAGAGAIAGAAAPLLGGLTIDALNWRWAFLIVVPPALIALVVASRTIDESTDAEGNAAPLDIAGAALATAGLAAVVFALINLPQLGWNDPLVLLVAATGVLMTMAFIAVQKNKKLKAMMPLGIFGSRSFTGISILTFMLYAAVGGLMVVLPYMLIERFSYTATEAGAALIPFPLIMGLLSRTFGGFATRVGIRLTLTLGPLLVAGGFALFAARASPKMGYGTDILPGLVVMALGMAITVAPLTTAVINAVSRRYVGVASGVNNAISRTAGLIATALIGFVIASPSKDGGMVAAFTNAAWVGVALALAGSIASFALIREDEVAGQRS